MAGDGGGASSGKGFWPEWITPRRIWEFFSRIVGLERGVRKLENDNETLRKEIAELRMIVVAHESELRLLTNFVRDSLSSRLEAKIDKLASEIVARKTKD